MIWAAMLAYIVIAPEVYARFILKEGKPLPFEHALPQPTDQISFAVDRLDSTKDQGLFHLWGWSFFRGDSNQAAYERWIILQSEENTYFYQAVSFQRPDLQSAFKDVKIDLLNAGYSTYISKYAIKAGDYQIGLLFVNKQTKAVHYIITNKSLVRTANHLRLQKSQPSDTVVSQPLAPVRSNPIQFKQRLPSPSNQLLLSVDGINPTNTNGQLLDHIWGWAFLSNFSSQDTFERWMVLEPDPSTSRTEDKPIFFPALPLERPDVQKAFEYLEIDLIDSGFSLYISKEDVQPGAYRIGILLKNTNNGDLYYAVTDKLLIRVSDQLQLRSAQ